MRRLGWEPLATGSLRSVVSGARTDVARRYHRDEELLANRLRAQPGLPANGCCYDRREEHEGYEQGAEGVPANESRGWQAPLGGGRALGPR